MEPSAGPRSECAADLHYATDLEATGLHARSTDGPSTTELHTMRLRGALDTTYRTNIARGGNQVALPPSYSRWQQTRGHSPTAGQRPDPDPALDGGAGQPFRLGGETELGV